MANNFVNFAKVKTKDAFESKLNTALASYKNNSIVFIEDLNCLYFNGKYYGSLNIEDITYANLKALRDNSSLIPGKKYRIIDYKTTTTLADTTVAWPDYTLIVTAISKSKLSEIALATSGIESAELEKTNLNAWQIWYCLDNDTNRFAWADTVNGKGVIYRMIDEFGNDCPYDFKSIKFKRYLGIAAYGYSTGVYLNYGKDIGPGLFEIMDTSKYKWCYTFEGSNPSELNISYDCSLNLNSGSTKYLYHTVTNNVIKLYYVLQSNGIQKLQKLNNIVFSVLNTNSGQEIIENSVGCNCYDMTIMGTYNKIGADCHGILLISPTNKIFNNTIGSKTCNVGISKSNIILNNLVADYTEYTNAATIQRYTVK